MIKIIIPIVGINGTKNCIVFWTLVFIVAQPGEVMGTPASAEKKEPKTVDAIKNIIPYDMINATILNAR